MNEPWVSIIIPAKNAEKTIERCLASVLNLDYDNYEVIVVDDGSQDKTGEIIQSFSAGVKTISCSQSRGPSRARNEAAAQAKGEFLAFTDADCVVARDWLKELLFGFSGPNIVSVGGMQEIPEDETKFGLLVAKFMQQAGFLTDYVRGGQEGLISVNHNPSCNVMYRKEAFLAEGGFLEGLWPGEDVELDHRLKKMGHGIVFNPRAIVCHYRPQDLKYFFKMMLRYGWAQGVLVRKYGIFRKVQLVPFLTPAVVFSLFVFSALASICLLSILLFSLLFCFRFNISMILFSIIAFISWLMGFYKGLLIFES